MLRILPPNMTAQIFVLSRDDVFNDFLKKKLKFIFFLKNLNF